MAQRRNCIHQGFAYTKNGYKNIKIVCDYDGKIHPKEYCKQCKNYIPRPNEKKTLKSVTSKGN